MSAYCPYCKSTNIKVLIAQYRVVLDYISTSLLKAGDRVLCKQCNWLGTVESLQKAAPGIIRVQ